MSVLRTLILGLSCMNQLTELTVLDRKFLKQKDLSEYCRRRVIPSVFLAREVVGAFSQILHFSRLEVPYSCFISVRTELGSNMIVVIDLQSGKSGLSKSCFDQDNTNNQFLVYEMGETFAQYWGALPHNAMKQRRTAYSNNSYLLKTTASTVQKTRKSSTTVKTTEDKDKKQKYNIKATEKSYYLTVDIPLVNVSAHLVKGELPKDVLFDAEELFDVQYDVTPKPGEEYSTKIVPLVEFSPMVFTPDSRITLPPLSSTIARQRKFPGSYKRRLNLKKNKHLFVPRKSSLSERTTSSYLYQPYRMRANTIVTRNYAFIKPSSPKWEQGNHSWDAIDDILKNITNSRYQHHNVDSNLENLLRGLVNTNYTKKANPVASKTSPSSNNAKIMPKVTGLFSGHYKTGSITWRPPSVTNRIQNLKEIINVTPHRFVTQSTSKVNTQVRKENGNSSVLLLPTLDEKFDSSTLLLPTLDVDSFIINVTFRTRVDNQRNQTSPVDAITESSASIMTKNITDKPLTSLVDHESWENVVQSASAMAVVLNKTATKDRSSKEQVVNATETKFGKRRRRKRYIQAIPIENARPHHRVNMTGVTAATVTHDWLEEDDMHHFIELEGDESHDYHLPLRYHLSHYTGSLLFNICNYHEPVMRHVYLFNSSRLLFLFTNFTLERMRVIVTPAHTLEQQDERCGDSELECQVSGARVCIDSLNACDGVPNCGANDIYDEDRLMCGLSVELHESMYLVSLMVIAVLLTCCYTVHYWLQRCVPKVSDAFFVYKDSAENILNLETIMRSPLDIENENYYRDANYHDMTLFDEIPKIRDTNRLVQCLKNFLCFYRRNHCKPVAKLSVIDESLYRVHTYVTKMDEKTIDIKDSTTCDAAIQTGPSLEIKEIDKLRVSKDSEDLTGLIVERTPLVQKIPSLDSELSQRNSELSMLSFLKRPRSLSIEAPGYNAVDISDSSIQTDIRSPEKVITVHKLSRGDETEANLKSILSSLITVHSEQVKGGQRNLKKHLRFVEDSSALTNVSSETVSEDNPLQRRSLVFSGNKMYHPQDMDAIEEMEEPGGSTPSKEFKSYFWGRNKNKKLKKKLSKQ